MSKRRKFDMKIKLTDSQIKCFEKIAWESVERLLEFHSLKHVLMMAYIQGFTHCFQLMEKVGSKN